MWVLYITAMAASLHRRMICPSDADLYFSQNTFLEAQGAQKLVTFSHKLVTICTWLAEFHQNPMGTFWGFCNSWHSD